MDDGPSRLPVGRREAYSEWHQRVLLAAADLVDRTFRLEAVAARLGMTAAECNAVAAALVAFGFLVRETSRKRRYFAQPPDHFDGYDHQGWFIWIEELLPTSRLTEDGRAEIKRLVDQRRRAASTMTQVAASVPPIQPQIVSARCGRCDQIIAPRARFCPRCGSSVSYRQGT